MKMIIIVFVLISSFVLFSVRAQNETVEYVCGPCACGNDHTVYNAPGNCPVCGMPLVNKNDVQQPQEKTMKAAIFIFEGVQIIDFTGPYEVLGQAGIDAFTVGEKADSIKTTMGMTVTPAFTFENAPPAEILIIPGGNVDPHLENENVIRWIRQRAETSQYVLSVCNGAFYLATAGLLDGREATTFYRLIDELKENFPKIRVLSDKRYADNGKILTSAGLSSGIDGTLHLVSKIKGKGFAQGVALNMEYNWQQDANYARANFADKYIRRMTNHRFGFEVPNQTSLKVLNTQGTADQWTAEWELKAKSTLAELQKFLESKLQENGKWTRQTTASSRTHSSQWKFAGDNGEPWIGTLNIIPIEGQQDVYKITLQIQRS